MILSCTVRFVCARLVSTGGSIATKKNCHVFRLDFLALMTFLVRGLCPWFLIECSLSKVKTSPVLRSVFRKLRIVLVYLLVKINVVNIYNDSWTKCQLISKLSITQKENQAMSQTIDVAVLSMFCCYSWSLYR